jgi:hypothetical protein
MVTQDTDTVSNPQDKVILCVMCWWIIYLIFVCTCTVFPKGQGGVHVVVGYCILGRS